MKVPEGVGWSGEAKPTVAQGLKIEKIADDLQHPRQLLVLPNAMCWWWRPTRPAPRR